MLILYRYRLTRTPDGRQFAFGYDRQTADVRIVELEYFDEAAFTGRTKDGVSLGLDGPPAFDMNAGALWAYYRAEHGIGKCVDITPAKGWTGP